MSKSKNKFNFKSLHLLVILLPLALTLTVWWLSLKQAQTDVQLQFEREAEQKIHAVLDRMKKYEDILWGGVATLKSHSSGFNRSEFKRFSERLRLTERYPGISGIGIIYRIEKSEKDFFINQIRKEKSDFAIYPESESSVYFPITFIEPELSNSKAVGLDMAHEENRLKALKKAESTGVAQVTGPIVLVQDQEKTPGFLFYAPFFKNENKKKLEGLVYAPFIFTKLMEGVLGNKNNRVQVTIYDKAQTLYTDDTEKGSIANLNKVLLINRTVDVYGRKWRFVVTPNILFTRASKDNKPFVILCAGVIINILLFLLFLTINRSKEEAVTLAAQMNKKAEEQKIKAVNAAKLASLGEMAGGIAHEINNPLAIISGNITRLRFILKGETLEKDKALETCKSIDATIFRISKIINSMRTLSRDGSKDPFVKTSVKDLISDVVIVCKEKFKQNEIDFKLPEIDEKLELMCRPVELSQVLVNLLNNAFDAVAEAENALIEIIVNKQNGKINIMIVNSGPGISDEVKGKIMTPFYTTKDVGKGTGLGLSISKKIIENHKGLFFLDLEAEKTTFVIELKAA